jgi:hypothetical protein
MNMMTCENDCAPSVRPSEPEPTLYRFAADE